MTHNDFVSHALTHEGAQAETTSESNSQRLRLPQLLLGLAVVAYALYFTWLTFLRFDAFEARALDLGNFDQAIWNTAHGRWFHLTNQDGIVNRLSLHVEPILIPISWLYWIASSPKTLLLLQAVVVGLRALPAYALARYELKNSWLALLFALSFLLMKQRKHCLIIVLISPMAQMLLISILSS